jgi:putative transposase
VMTRACNSPPVTPQRRRAPKGLVLRHDHGSSYMSADFQGEIHFLGIECSPSFVR